MIGASFWLEKSTHFFYGEQGRIQERYCLKSLWVIIFFMFRKQGINWCLIWNFQHISLNNSALFLRMSGLLLIVISLLLWRFKWNMVSHTWSSKTYQFALLKCIASYVIFIIWSTFYPGIARKEIEWCESYNFCLFFFLTWI